MSMKYYIRKIDELEEKVRALERKIQGEVEWHKGKIALHERYRLPRSYSVPHTERLTVLLEERR